MKPRIAIVEDEPAIAEVLQYNLDRGGFAVEVFTSGDSALEAIRKSPPDLVLLDLMLPGIDGLEITRFLKRDKATAGIPLVMITARDSETDRIVGLELGADDYVTKPFSPREVVLRVKAILRRTQAQTESDQVYEQGPLRLAPDAHRAWVDDRELDLTATEFRLLAILMERAGRVQSRARLLADVWEYQDGVESRTVDTHMRRLRQKLGEAGSHIETVIGIGYRFQP